MIHNGIEAVGTDIAIRKNEPNYCYGIDNRRRIWRAGACDFLGDLVYAIPYRDIVTNPPYSLAEAFIRRAHELKARKIAVLVRLDFLASQKRHKLFTEDHPPQDILVLSRRPSMPPGPITPDTKRNGGQHDFMWVVWDSLKSWRPCQVQWVK